MKLELKENMYVRTKDGYISQYKYYDYNIGEGLIGKMLCIPLSNGTFANIENIKKFNYNIIYILEKGDYVNGSEVLDFENKYTEEDDKFVPIGVITENCYLENTDSWIIEKNIKTVITHEQFEQMAYRVGE